jgi:hypothetical protein
MALHDIPPGLFTIIAEILGLYVADNLKLNQQNSVGNWLQLVGQVILTFNAQQQLRQQGPGTSPSAGINYEATRLHSAQPLSNIIDELPQDLLQHPEIQQKISQESAEATTQNGKSKNSYTSKTNDPTENTNNLDALNSKLVSLTNEVEELKRLVSILAARNNDN